MTGSRFTRSCEKSFTYTFAFTSSTGPSFDLLKPAELHDALALVTSSSEMGDSTRLYGDTTSAREISCIGTAIRVTKFGKRGDADGASGRCSICSIFKESRTKLDGLDVKKGSRRRNKTMELTRTCRVNPGIGLVHYVDA